MKPALDIVTTVYNQFSFAQRTIEHVLKNTEVPYTYTLVHNCSPYGETRKFIKDIEEKRIHSELPANCHALEVIQNKENFGVSKAYNIGFKRGAAPFLCKLDDDVLVPPNWATPLILAFEAVPNLGACSAYLTADSSGIRPDKGSMTDGHADYPLFFDYTHQRTGLLLRTEEYHTVGGWCMVTPRKLFERSGGFDERQLYGIADGLYSQTLRYIGYKVCYIKNVEVKHLARTEESDSGYDKWKTVYALGQTREEYR